MSHFTNVQAGLTDKDALHKGLINLLAEHKLSNIQVEVHEKPVVIHNGYGEGDELAEVIIRREQLSKGAYPARVDIGFAKSGETYHCVIDHYDYRNTILRDAFYSVENFLEAVQKSHTKVLIERDYPTDKWNINVVEHKDERVFTVIKKEVEVYI